MNDVSDANKIEERRFSAANRAFDGHHKSMSDSMGMLSSFANNAMRAPPIAAAAGVAGLLGFFSANKGSILKTAAVQPFNDSLFYLCGCIALSVAAPALAYLSQYFFTSSLSKHTFHYDHEYVRETTASKIYEAIGTGFHLLAILLVLASMALLAVGGWYFIELVGFLAK